MSVSIDLRIKNNIDFSPNVNKEHCFSDYFVEFHLSSSYL